MRRLSKELLEQATQTGDRAFQVNEAICETIASFLDDDAVLTAVFKSMPDSWVTSWDTPPQCKYEFVAQYVYEALGLAPAAE